jgi:PAS domain-containing protein
MSEYFRTDDPNFFPIVAHRRALAGESATYEHEWAGNCYQIHLEPLRDAEGRIVGCIGIALDITVRKRAQQGYLDRYEVQFKRKDGSPYRTLLSLRPILIKGKRCWQAVVEDITAHKHAEEALQKAHAELLHANTVLQEQIAERKCPQPPGESHFVGASLAGKRAGIAQFDRTNYPF